MACEHTCCSTTGCDPGTYGRHFQQSMDQPGTVANPARSQLKRETSIFHLLHSRSRTWSRERGLAVLSRVSLPIFHTQTEYGASSRDLSPFLRRHPYIPSTSIESVPNISGRAIATDGAPCRESTCTGAVVLKAVPVTGAAFSGFTMDQCLMRLSFPTPTVGTVPARLEETLFWDEALWSGYYILYTIYYLGVIHKVSEAVGTPQWKKAFTKGAYLHSFWLISYLRRL